MTARPTIELPLLATHRITDLERGWARHYLGRARYNRCHSDYEIMTECERIVPGGFQTIKAHAQHQARQGAA